MSEYRIAILGDGGVRETTNFAGCDPHDRIFILTPIKSYLLQTGKSAIIFRQMNNVFVEDSDPTFEVRYKIEV
jgi:hypothetical protein